MAVYLALKTMPPQCPLPISWLKTAYFLIFHWSLHSPLILTYHHASVTCKIISFETYAIQFSPSDTLSWDLHSWMNDPRMEGMRGGPVFEIHAIYAIFAVVIFWPLLSLNSLLQVLPSPRWFHYVKIFNTLASFFLNIGNNNHHFTATVISWAFSGPGATPLKLS